MQSTIHIDGKENGVRLESRILEERIQDAVKAGARELTIDACGQHGIDFKVRFDVSAHDRWIRTDTGWRINLGRGLDIFQKFEGGWMDFGTSRQEFRQVREFGITYIREKAKQ